jgi:predicted kinase
MTSELIVFSGLQASGKTTFYRERFATSHVHVSKDHWPNARNKEARQRRLVDDHLRAGRSVVVDNTNPTPAEREPLIAIARAAGARAVSYAFITAVSEAVQRNALRAGRARISDAGIYSVAKRLCPVLASEGFDRRFVVQLTDQGFIVTDVAAEAHPLDEVQLPEGSPTSR